MIEFLQDYKTQAVPPETFEAGQQVKRSEASELYFVRLGVAGFVTDAGLVNEDHRPIGSTLTSVAEVVTPGLDAPQRATSGPGNAILAGGDQQITAAVGEIERLTAELADANAEGNELAQGADRLKLALATEQQAHSATREELGRVRTDLDAAQNGRAEAEKAHAAAKARIEDLERQLAEATKPATEQQDGKSQPASKADKAK